MANEPTGASTPEPRPERSAESTRKSTDTNPAAPNASRDGQPEHSAGEPGADSSAAKTETTAKPTGIQIQPATGTVARHEGGAEAVVSSTEAKPGPTDAPKEQAPPTTTEGTESTASKQDISSPESIPAHTPEDDNPYHQETTDYHHDHHDDYHHHDDPYHQEHQHNDPYHYQGDDHGHGHGSGGGWVPPTGTGSGDDSTDKPDEDDGYGGPIKGFIDHLEDLRWMLVKCVAALLVSAVVCLVAGNLIVSVLKYPLVLATQITSANQPPMVQLTLGTNEMWLPVSTNHFFKPINMGTNNVLSYNLVPTLVGTNLVLGLEPNPNPPAGPHKNINIGVMGPGEVFSVMLDIVLYGGIALALPFVLVFIGQFVMPALRPKEKKWLIQGVSIGAGLFLAGVAFCYFLLMKITLYATAEIAEWMGFVSEQWRAAEYVSFMCKFLVGMGICFELPVLILTMVRIGILSYRKLADFRAYMFVILLVISAFVTPTGDPFTMLLMAFPLYLLYELSILVAWIWHRRDLRAQAAAEKAEREGK
jgi:sec-independent protein translocase protein TatC